MRRRNSLIVLIVGVLMLTYSIWRLNNSLSHYKIEKIVTRQGHDQINTQQSQRIAAYVHPNKGVGLNVAPYDLAIQIKYKNVNGTLHIDHYYSDFGVVAHQPTQELNIPGRDVTGDGSITFVTTANYVGIHVMSLTPDYEPSSAIEVWISTIHYELRPEQETVVFSLTLSFIGTFLASTGITLASNVRNNKEA